jgi:hypothetical protein|uniref:Uncharacterized protein n=1 Tax=Picea glauca TaxID=3330 RepID=A0A117NIQ1_PICGL|nr:hypothetical protein ABT39_MTgene113 [Picea glauca]
MKIANYISLLVVTGTLHISPLLLCISLHSRQTRGARSKPWNPIFGNKKSSIARKYDTMIDCLSESKK